MTPNIRLQKIFRFILQNNSAFSHLKFGNREKILYLCTAKNERLDAMRNTHMPILPKLINLYFMTQKPMINGEAMNALLETTLAVEQFLNENYSFRRNVLNGKVEFVTHPDSLTWRFASFVATTNNPHPLTDPTGSRRYICLQIPEGQYIDNTGKIDYGQLYAQVVYELTVAKTPYWFTNDEVARIQQLSLNHLQQKDIGEMVEVCFRKPKKGEVAQLMNTKMLLTHIQKEYPSVDINHGNKVRVGHAMTILGYEHTDHSNVPFYKVIPLAA